MRNYFITAAKDLIRGEGLAVVSTRNVAERAGYSYATLYNYFKDIRDLIFSCVEDFMSECRDFVQQGAKKATPGAEGLEAVSKSYAKFFVQYPGIFDLFFQQKQSAISTKSSNFTAIRILFRSLAEADWKEIGKTKKLSEEDAATASDCHSLAIHGLLMLYVNRRKEMEYRQLMEEVARLTLRAIAGAGAE